ncbi:MAG: NAD(P)/FAD-dependent oxidoreductase [Bacteroidales bacterium]|jgi:NADH dehydrogenase|nr:NAD(P)/FAD-dependent oxidoreductase [Bacteroidales bacterium]
MNKIPRILIIGGGFGGITLIQKLKNKPVEIILIDRYNHHNFQPLMYQVATCGLSATSIASPFRRMFKGYRNFTFHLAEVQKIDAENNFVDTTIGKFEYDYLVIATGSETNFYNNSKLAKNSLVMKTLDDALTIRNTLLEQFERATLYKKPEEKKIILNFVIIGGGATGVELAGALAEFKSHIIAKDYPEIDPSLMNIHLIEAGNRLLPAMSDGASVKANEFLTKMGVKVWLSTMVKDYDGVNVTLTDETVLRSAFFIWSAGVKGKLVEGLKPSSIQKDRILVDEFHKVRGYDNIFSIGDVAAMITTRMINGHPMLAFPAMQQGSNLALNFLLQLKGKPPRKFYYFDLGTLATVGRHKAVADLPFLRTQGFFAWFLWMGLHLIRITGFRNRLKALSDWVWNYFTYAYTYRIITRPSCKQ